MNEPRYINANDLKDTLDYYIREAGWTAAHNEALTWVKDEFIDAERTADVAPAVHGHWITVYREDGTKADKCSVCTDAVKYFDYKYGWCPHCGAKMDESEVNDNGRT